MNSVKRLTFSLLGLVVISGCGVKGDPLPPEKPPELGRGKPTYRRATEEIQIEGVHGNPSKSGNGDEDGQQ